MLWFIPLPIRFQGRRFPVPNLGYRLYRHRHQYPVPPFPISFQGSYRSRYLRQFRRQFPNRCQKLYPRRFLRQCRGQFLRQSLSRCKLRLSREPDTRLFVRLISNTHFLQLWLLNINLTTADFWVSYQLTEVEGALFTKVHSIQLCVFAVRVFGSDIKHTASIRTAVVSSIPLKVCFFAIGNGGF